MKKLGILVIAASLLASTAFAADITASGVFVDQLLTGGKNADAAAYGLGKSRVTLGLKADDKVSVTYIAKLDANFSMDYVYADVATDIGKLRAGILYDQIANFGGGIYQTNTFLARTIDKGNGLGLYTKFDIYNIGLFNITAPFAKNAIKVYGAKVDTAIDAFTVGAVAKAGVNDDKTGYGVEVEGSYKIGAAKISAQYYTDLNDDGGLLLHNVAGAAGAKMAYLGLYGEYNLGAFVNGLGVYADWVQAMNDDTKAAWQESQLKAGASYNLNTKATVYAEIQANNKVNNIEDASKVYSSNLGLQVKF